jgi:Erv1 / Alr family
MNLDPIIWGGSYWNTFHLISLTYESDPGPSVRETMKKFIETIPMLLPCTSCRDHAFDFLRSRDIDEAVSNRDTLFRFFFEFHNDVNKRLNKPLMSYKSAHEKYFSLLRQSSTDFHTPLLATIVVLLAGYFILEITGYFGRS